MARKKHPGGRPTVMTNDTLEKLEYAFSRGLNLTESCLYADISLKTFYNYTKKHEEFLQRLELLKGNMRMRAKLNLADKLDEGDDYNSRWYLEKTSDEFNPKSKQEVTGKDGGAINIAFRWEDE